MPGSTPTLEATPPWYQVLQVARELSPSSGQTFTAPELAKRADLRDTVNPKTGKIVSRGSQIASAWLSKFTRWGYVDKLDKVDTGASGRPANTYAVTKVGHACVPTEGRELKLSRLISAIRALQKARRTPREAGALEALLKVCDDVEGR